MKFQLHEGKLVETTSAVNESHFSIFPTLPRVDAQEWLDTGIGTTEDVEANFVDMWRINRYLGGVTALTSHLYPRLLAAEGTVNLVDNGVGSGALTRTIGQWAEQHRIAVRLHGLDLSARNLVLARRDSVPGNSIKFIQGDALHLPLRKGSVDYFMSSLFIHHLSPEQVKSFLSHTFESANRGIIMSDLVRGWLPLLAFRLSMPIFARNYLTRHDGLVSIRRAYTPSELLSLAQQAGLANARIYQHFPWRMTLVADK